MRAENEVSVEQAQSGLILRLDYWTPTKVDLLKRTVAIQGCTDDEFALFLEQCKRTGLNPFLKQAYMVERSANVNGRWIKRFEFLAAEIGMAARANMFPDWRGMRGFAVFDGDHILMDPAAGAVEHRFNPAKRIGNLVGAWAHGRREGHDIPLTYLPIESRKQMTREGRPTKFWATMPEGQIAKCARAEQYRLAYPQIFSGVYIREEMPEGDSVALAEQQPQRPSPAPTSGGNRTQAVTEHLQRVTAPKQSLLESGRLKDRAVTELPQEELELVTAKARDWLADTRHKKGRPALERDLGRFTAELGRRAAQPAQTPAEEPHVEADGEPPPPSDSDAPFSSE